MMTKGVTTCKSQLNERDSAILKSIALKQGLDTNEILHRVMQQLPRLSDSERENRFIVSQEIERIAESVERAKREFKYLIEPPQKSVDIKELFLKEIPRQLGNAVNLNLHYIGYSRANSDSIGLFFDIECKSRLVSMITLSPFDLAHVQPSLPKGINSENVLVLSRIFAFDWAPKNCISFMMGQTYRWLRRKNPSIKLLLTYLNPNVCFSGVTYKASNWVLYGIEPGLKYAYLDKKYITLRALKERFHTSDIDYLKRMLGDKLGFSKHELDPLELYCYSLDRHLKISLDSPLIFWKKPPIT